MKIAVVTAWNARNAGMYSVDLAALQLLRPLGVRLSLFRTQALLWRLPRFQDGRMLHRLRRPETLSNYDVILYWGDFLNNPLYGLRDFSRREAKVGRSGDPAAAFESWKRFCLLKSVDTSQSRVISVSNNMQSANAVLADLPAEDAGEIRELVTTKFDAFFPRDPVSTGEVRTIVGDSPRPTIAGGVDAAFLLTDHLVGRPDPALPRNGYFTYFLGRSSLDCGPDLIDEIARATGLAPVPLTGWLKFGMTHGRRAFSALTTLIANSALVVTDTYHCCVNTMALGRPLIGVGRAQHSQDSSVADYKKRVLFDMFGLGNAYVEFPERPGAADEGAIGAAAELARRYLADGLPDGTYDQVRTQTETYRRLLLETILGTHVGGGVRPRL